MRIKTVDISELLEDPKNGREHGERNMKAISDSLETFGQVEPLVVRENLNTVVGGNGRLRAMRELGWKQAKVVYVDFDDEKVAALAIALNRTAELASWNEVTLSEVLASITNNDLLSATGFSDVELRKLSEAHVDGLEAAAASGPVNEVATAAMNKAAEEAAKPPQRPAPPPPPPSGGSTPTGGAAPGDGIGGPKGTDADGQWFYVEYYGQNELYQELRSHLAGAMKNKHEINAESFAEMVALYSEHQRNQKSA